MGGVEASRVPREYPADAPARQSRRILPKKSQTGCQNLGAASSNRVRTRQDTIDVDCCVREYKIGEKVNERLTLFVFPPHLLVIIGCL